MTMNRHRHVYQLPDGGWVRVENISEVSSPRKTDDARWRVFLHALTGQLGYATFDTKDAAQLFADHVAAAMEEESRWRKRHESENP